MLVTLIPTAFAESKTVEARKTSQKLELDGEAVNVGFYNIEGNNYIKLRDLAAIVMGKKWEFNVSYNNEEKVVSIDFDKPYEKVKGDLEEIKVEKASAALNKRPMIINGTKRMIKTALIDGNNYVQLRDISRFVGLEVGYIAETKTITLKSDGLLHNPDVDEEEKPEEEKPEEKEEEKWSYNDNVIFTTLINIVNASIDRYKDYTIIPFTGDDGQDTIIEQVNLSIIYGQRLYTDGAKIEKSIEMREGVKTYIVKFTYPSGAYNIIEGSVDEKDMLSATDKMVVGPIIGFIDKDKNIDKMPKDELLAKFTKAHDAIADGDYKKACEVLRELNYDADEAKLEKLVKIKKEDAKKLGGDVFLKDYEASIEAKPFDNSEYILITFKYKDGSLLRFDVQHDTILGLGLIAAKN